MSSHSFTRGSTRWLSLVQLLALASVICCILLIPYRYLAIDGFPGLFMRYFPFVVISVFTILLVLFRTDVVAQLWKTDPLKIPIVAVLTMEAVSALGGINATQSLQKVGYYFLTGPTAYFLVRWQALEDHRSIGVLLWIIAGSAGLAATYGISDFWIGKSWLFADTLSLSNKNYASLVGHADFGRRAMGTMGHPVVFGAILLLSLPVSLSLLAQPKTGHRLLSGFISALIVGALFLTFSRGAWLGLLVAAIVYSAYTRSKRLLILVLSGIAAVGGLVAGWDRLYELMETRDPYSEFVQNFGNNARVQAYSYVAQVFPKDIYLGSGLGTYQIRSRSLGSTLNTPDNMYLLRLVETGLVGLIALVFLLREIVECLARSSRIIPAVQLGQSAAFPALMLSCIVGFMVEMATFDALHFAAIRTLFWMLLGIGCTSLPRNAATGDLGAVCAYR